MTINETLETIKSQSAELYFKHRRGLDVFKYAESLCKAWQKSEEAKNLCSSWCNIMTAKEIYLEVKAIEDQFVKAIEEAIAYEERIN